MLVPSVKGTLKKTTYSLEGDILTQGLCRGATTLGQKNYPVGKPTVLSPGRAVLCFLLFIFNIEMVVN